MDPETRDMDTWMKKALTNWTEQGALSPEKSAQLRMSIAQLASQEKKNRFKRKVCGLVAGIITFLWLLLANCPVAAAAYRGSTAGSTHSLEFKAVILILVLFGFIIKYQYDLQVRNKNFEVNYD